MAVPLDDAVFGVLWLLLLLLVVRRFTPLWCVLPVSPEEATVTVLLHVKVGDVQP